MKKTIIKVFSIAMLSIPLVFSIPGCHKDHNNYDPYNPDSLLAKSKCANPIPGTLTVPAGNKLVLYSYGKGVQIYEVQRSATDPKVFLWVNTAPLATIYAREDFTKPLADHFGGPTWDFTDGPLKGQKVVAARLQSIIKEPSAIAWLLLKSNDSLSVNSKVSYVQRLCTEGGLPPTTGADEQHLGQQVRIPYTAAYLFYQSIY